MREVVRITQPYKLASRAFRSQGTIVELPRGVRIGTVTSQKNSDANPFKNIQVRPLVDFSSLQSVIVLVPNQ